MGTKLNIWRWRDLTLSGRIMLAKSLGLSQLIYTASMLSVPETIIQQTQNNYLPFYGRIREIRSSDSFGSVPYVRVS